MAWWQREAGAVSEKIHRRCDHFAVAQDSVVAEALRTLEAGVRPGAGDSQAVFDAHFGVVLVVNHQRLWLKKFERAG